MTFSSISWSVGSPGFENAALDEAIACLVFILNMEMNYWRM
jgi:hypothetical protein